MRILLVEDDPDLSRALQSGLERQGVVADGVGSLAEAAFWIAEGEDGDARLAQATAALEVRLRGVGSAG
ncbi:hypothetical protein G6F40_017319 [Rhizopus arrhizus]|nr:hypothetical protein G6F40_017319 [Rhizopus arrhizus]